MNEDALLEGFRENLAGPDDDLLTQMRGCYRMPDTSRRQRFETPRRRRWIVPAAVAATVVLALVLPAIVPLGRPGSPDPAAARLLRRFSTLAAHLPGEPAPKPGQYVYTRSKMTKSFLFSSGSGVRFAYTVPVTTSQWVGTDGSAARCGRGASRPSRVLRIRSRTSRSSPPESRPRRSRTSTGEPPRISGSVPASCRWRARRSCHRPDAARIVDRRPFDRRWPEQ